MSRSATLAALAGLLTFVSAFVPSAHAAYIPIDFTSVQNLSWQPYINGHTFPTGAVTLGGVPYGISNGVLQVWSSESTSGSPRTVTIQVDQFAVTDVHTIMHTYWGQVGPLTFVSFSGSAGASHTVGLVGGVDIRDYNQAAWLNTIGGGIAREVWSNGLGQRLDAQHFVLPAEFATQTLKSITIADYGAPELHRTALAALTVWTVPAPGPVVIMLAAAAAIARRARR